MKAIRDPDELIRDSGLFDEAWYVARHPDVRDVGLPPLEHFLRIGARLLRSPGPAFDTAYYLEAYPDVADSGVNPLVHFLLHGRGEGRRAKPVPRPPRRPEAPEARSVRTAAENDPPGILPINRIPGRRRAVEGAPTLLVCAHVSGQHLFGSERSLIDMLDGLTAAGYNVITTVPGSRHGAYQDAIRDRSVAVLSFRYGWWRKDQALDERVVATIASIVHEYGIAAVYANTIMLREPLAAARRMGVPSVVHAREIIQHDVALCELIGESAAAIVEQVLASADHVVANSEATARAFARGAGVHVIPNTVDLDLFATDPAPVGDEIRISMASSNLPKKGIFDFVEVARLVESRAPQARFLLVGPETAHVEALRAGQAAGEIPANIVFAGYRDDPVAAIADADIVVNFSHFQESFGRTVLEAMAAGKPVVAYDWGALPELVREGENGHVVPFADTAAAADAIVRLCGDREMLRRMGEAGRFRARAEYGKPAYAQRMRSAFESVLAPVSEKPKLVLPARRPSRGGDGEPLRIAYFLWHFPVPSETFVLNELRILVEQGHDVLVFCRQSPHKDFVPDFPVTWHRVDSAETLAQRLRETDRQIVHSHFTYPTVTDMVWPACELAGVDFTFIAHAQDIFRHTNDERNRIGEIGRSPRCVRVLVPSRFHREYVISRGVPPDKVLINPNGVDPELYVRGVDPARAARRARSICAIHRFTAKKGLDLLIAAGAELAADGIQIHLYGYGELEQAYRTQIEGAGLSNVHLHGPVAGREAMLDVFSQHDLFACPSVRAEDGDMDGIPTVLMEAMAAGMPVLTTSLSGIPDLVQDGISGFLCDPSVAGITGTVRRFYALPDRHVQAVIDEAREVIRRDFNSARLTATLVRLWRGQTVDLLIVSWNNLPELQEVVRRLCAYTTMPFHLVVCDNDSRGDVAAFLCRLYAQRDDVTVVFNRRNALVGPGTNICLAHGGSDYAVYVCGKEGFVLDFGWETDLVRYMDENPEVGLAGTLCHSPSYLFGAQYPERLAEFPRFRNPGFATDNPTRKFGHVQGGFFAMRRSMVDRIGGFSDEVPHNYTDVEYSYYAESCGWKLGEAPRMLALFNKTRPDLLSRIDDNVRAAHPPTLADLPLLDRLVRREGVYCNACGWYAAQFEGGSEEARCENCSSTPADRSLFRLVAGSLLTYRRLPALGVGIGPALDAFWRHQFQGEPTTAAELRRELQSAGRLQYNPGRVKLVCLRGVLDGGAGDEAIMREVDRILAPDGMLLVQSLDGGRGPAPRFDDGFLARWKLDGVEHVRLASSVARFCPDGLHVFRRGPEDLCVS